MKRLTHAISALRSPSLSLPLPRLFVVLLLFFLFTTIIFACMTSVVVNGEMEVEADPFSIEFLSETSGSDPDSKNADTKSEFSDEDSDESAGADSDNAKSTAVHPKSLQPADKIDDAVGQMDLFQQEQDAADIAADFAW